MSVHRAARSRSARLATCLCLPIACGCGASLTDSGVPSTLNLAAFGNAHTHVESDSNNLLEMAETVPSGAGRQLIRGRITSSDDVDVYDLGPVEAGDRVLVEVDADSLDGAVALFDGEGSLLLVNDHRNVYLGRNGPFVDLVVRRPAESCMVALAATPGYTSTGAYVMAASLEPGAAIPQPRSDAVLLNFAAQRSVRIGTRPTVNVPDFDAANILPQFQGDTDQIISLVVELVRADFAAYDVTILSTSEGAVADSTTSQLHFGTFDAALLGVAEGVDEYNAHSAQSAIVFTDTFEAFRSLDPSVEEMAQALANVASHEIGHLLGLIHTKNPDDIMDVTASLNELLLDQVFARSPVYSAVFPLGSQDSVQSLLDAVGGDETAARAASAGLDRSGAEVKDRSPLFRARGMCLLSSCGLHGH